MPETFAAGLSLGFKTGTLVWLLLTPECWTEALVVEALYDKQTAMLSYVLWVYMLDDTKKAFAEHVFQPFQNGTRVFVRALGEGIVMAVGRPGRYTIRLRNGKLVSVRQTDLQEMAIVESSKRPVDTEDCKPAAIVKTKDLPCPKMIWSGAKELFLHIHPALLKNFIPHLFSRESETVVDKRGRAVRYLLPADNMVFPWMKQGKMKEKIGFSMPSCWCTTSYLTNKDGFWSALSAALATIAAGLHTAVSVAISVYRAGSSTSDSTNSSTSSSSKSSSSRSAKTNCNTRTNSSSFNVDTVMESAYGRNIACLMSLANSVNVNSKTVAGARTWLLANKDSLELSGHPLEQLLQPLHMQALDSSLLDKVAFSVAAVIGWAVGSFVALLK